MIDGQMIRLRAIEPEDIQLLCAWENDPGIAMYLETIYPQSQETVERHYRNTPTRRWFVVEDRNHGAPIGTTVVDNIDWENGRAEIGLWIGVRRQQDRGLGTDLVRTLLHLCFERLNLQRVELSVLEFNQRARRVYEKCGFKVEGIRRRFLFRDGQYHNMVLMAVLRQGN